MYVVKSSKVRLGNCKLCYYFELKSSKRLSILSLVMLFAGFELIKVQLTDYKPLKPKK